jgi:hypothetical protein
MLSTLAPRESGGHRNRVFDLPKRVFYAHRMVPHVYYLSGFIGRESFKQHARDRREAPMLRIIENAVNLLLEWNFGLLGAFFECLRFV